MRTMVWTIGVVVLVDLTVVAWFVTRELIERQRARREVALLDEMWREPAVAVVRPRRSAAPGSAWEAARSAV
ncbi:MAG TPA: hypothetical protein VFM57_03090, partial [Thermoleophilaceae bacterium]|nr:hypothetical protein [Thermoleophilaceae bacterium]